MPVASSQRKRFADGNIASRGVCGRASGRGSPLSCGWNFHREALSDSPGFFSTCVYPRSSRERRRTPDHSGGRTMDKHLNVGRLGTAI
jgi:hypothetical protein